MNAQLVEFELETGNVVSLLISDSIPIGIIQMRDKNQVIITHPTHNNGGYRLDKNETLERVTNKINKALGVTK
jgi:hypothetical protein